MESIAAFSLAANIVQFIQFSATLFSEASQLYHSATGSTIDNAELQLIANNVKQLTANIKASPASRDSHHLDAQLRKISDECLKVSEELVTVLDEVRVKGQYRRWESFRQAVKSLRHEKKIKDLKNRLGALQQGLIMSLVGLMK